MINVQDHGAMGDGETDDTEAIRWAIKAADNVVSRHLYFPPGRYRIPVVVDAPIFVLPSDFTVSGAGRSSVLKWEARATDNSCYLFYVIGGHDVTIEGLRFVGSNSPFQYVPQVQSAGVTMWGNCKDITVRDCEFENLWGFSVHGVGGGFQGVAEREHVIDCKMTNCGNGLNINCDYSIQRGNVMLNTEGIEFTGIGCHISNNIMRDTIGTGISAGGSGGLFPGSIVSGNIIDGATQGGIMCGDSFVHSQVINNTIRKCATGGIMQHEIGVANGWSIAAFNLFSGNTLLDCGGEGAAYGMRISGTGSNTISNNRIIAGSHVDYATLFALMIASPNNYVFGNYLQGRNMDLILETHALATRLGPNLLAGNGFSLQGNATLWPQPAVP